MIIDETAAAHESPRLGSRSPADTVSKGFVCVCPRKNGSIQRGHVQYIGAAFALHAEELRGCSQLGPIPKPLPRALTRRPAAARSAGGAATTASSSSSASMGGGSSSMGAGGSRLRTAALVNLAMVVEQANEQVLPAVYLFVGRSLNATPVQLGTLTLCRAMVQVSH